MLRPAIGYAALLLIACGPRKTTTSQVFPPDHSGGVAEVSVHRVRQAHITLSDSASGDQLADTMLVRIGPDTLWLQDALRRYIHPEGCPPDIEEPGETYVFVMRTDVDGRWSDVRLVRGGPCNARVSLALRGCLAAITVLDTSLWPRTQVGWLRVR